MKNDGILLAIGGLFYLFGIVVAVSLNNIMGLSGAVALGLIGCICIFLGLRVKKSQREEFYNSLVEKIVTQNTENTNDLKKEISQSVSEISNLSELTKKNTDAIVVLKAAMERNIVGTEAVKTEIQQTTVALTDLQESSKDSIDKSVERLVQNVNDVINESKKQHTELQQALRVLSNELSDEQKLISKEIGNVAQLQDKNNNLVLEVAKSISNLNDIPNEVLKTFDEISESIKEIQEEQRNIIEELADDIRDENGNTSRDMRRTVNAISDNFDTVSQVVQTEIQKLAEEYKAFEKHSDAVIDKLTLMSKNDIEAMRKFINGK